MNVCRCDKTRASPRRLGTYNLQWYGMVKPLNVSVSALELSCFLVELPARNGRILDHPFLRVAMAFELFDIDNRHLATVLHEAVLTIDDSYNFDTYVHFMGGVGS